MACSISERSGRSHIAFILVAAIATLVLGLGIATSAQAQGVTVDSVQSYSWGNDAGLTWTPIPDAANQDDIEHEVPGSGFMLVELNYTVPGGEEVDRIDFNFLLWSDYDGDADDIETAEYRYVINEQGDGHDSGFSDEDQNVYLARDVDAQLGPSLNDTGGDGCEDRLDKNESGLRNGTPEPGSHCYFLIELDNQSGGSPLQIGDSVHYLLEVEVQGDSLVEGGEGSERTVIPVSSDVNSIDVSYEPSSIPNGDVEAGVPVDVTAEIEVGDSDSGRDTTSEGTDWVPDAWFCLFDREETDPHPYSQFSEIPVDHAGGVWDEPVACEFDTNPAHDHDGNEPAHAVAFDQVEYDANDQVWTFEHTFTIPRDEIETTTTRFIDQFDFHVVVRDGIANVETADEPMDLARYDIDELPISFDNGTAVESPEAVDIFTEDNPQECYQVDNAKYCYRAVDAIPSHQDEAPFQFQVLLRNYANYEDEIDVSVDQIAGDEWEIDLIGVDSNDQVAVPAGDAQAQKAGLPLTPEDFVDPGEVVIEVHLTPDDTTVAPAANASATNFDFTGDEGWTEVEVTAESVNTEDETSSRPLVTETLRAFLVENARGTIEFGDDGESQAEIALNATENVDTPITVGSTGNTDGPFAVALADDADDECEINPVNANEKIELEVRDPSTGQPIEAGEDIRPTRTAEYDLRATVGESVPLGTYNCELSFDAGGIVVDTDEPTLIVEVLGEPDIKVWDLEGADDDQVDVTDGEIHRIVSPDQNIVDVFFYLENVGDIGLDPALDTGSGFEVSDRYALDGTWEGRTQEPDTISLASAAQPFNLPPSDEEDTEHVLVKDLFNLDANDRPPRGSVDDLTEPGDRWYCAADDSQQSSSSDPRRVCQVHMRLDVSDRSPVIGDRAEFEFTWQDLDEEGLPATTNIVLEFGYAGDVEATMVEDKALQDGSSSLVEFEAFLDDGHRFDPSSNEVEANVSASAGDTCSASGPITSITESEQHARFQLEVEHDESSQCGLANDVLTVTGVDETVQIELEVTDENGTPLRHLTPAHIDLKNTADGSPSLSDEELRPGQTLQADGHQFVEYLFQPDSDAVEGVVLSRSGETHGLEPYPDLGLKGDAFEIGSGDLRDSTLLPAEEFEDGDLSYNVEDRIDANATEFAPGAIMHEQQRSGEDEPTQVGRIDITGWGDGGEIDWTEGWNPLVMKITDLDDNPVQDDVQASDFDLDLMLTTRGGSEDLVQDIYHLSTDDGTILTRSLGGGYLAVDIYLPRSLNQSSLDGKELSDHPMDRRAEVELEAWALALETGRNVESTSGEDLSSGVAYWRAADLGLLTDETPHRFNGTMGDSNIQAGNDAETQAVILEEDPDGENIERLHIATQFLNGPIGPGDDWRTGPGIHDYSVFVLHEDDEQRSNSLTLGNNETAEDVRVHEFRPYSEVTPELVVSSVVRGSNVPGAGSFTLEENATLQGLYSTFFGLPDAGRDVTWISQLEIKEEGASLVETAPKDIEQLQDRQAASSGIPMPLAIPHDADLFDEEDNLNPRSIFDTRALPGFLPDRGDFGIAALIEDSGSVHLSLTEDTLFTVEGEGLLTIGTSNLPTTGEQDRPIRLTGDRAISPEPASAVQDIEVELRLDGDLVDSAMLTDDESNAWTGQVTPEEVGTHRLIVRATDTAGGLTTVGVNVEVAETQPPEIEIEAPAEVDDYRAMSTNGTIQAVVLDNAVVAGDITLEERMGEDGADPEPIEEENVSLSGILDPATVGAHESFSVEFANLTDGTAWVNVTGVEGYSNIQAAEITGEDDDGSASGNITFNETGTATISIETSADEDTWDTSFSVTVNEEDDDGWTAADPEIECEAAVCELTHSPSGLEGGDTYQFRITATVGDDTVTTDPVDVLIDASGPDVTIELPEGDAAGPDTEATVTATDDVPSGVDDGIITNLVLTAIQDDTELGSTTLSGNDGTATLSQLGATEEGEITLQANATNLAGLTTTETQTVTVDATGPDIDTPQLESVGSDIEVTVDATDAAGVDTVRLFHRAPGSSTFSSSQMDANGDAYTSTISEPGTSGTLEYYVQATDVLGNEDTLRSQQNPFTANLEDIFPEVLSVDILAPEDGATVGGTTTIEVSTFTPLDDANVTVDALEVTLADGSTVELGVEDPEADLFEWDTTDLEDQSVTIEVSVTDGTDTATDSVTVTVENTAQIPGGACPDVDEINVGQGVELCFTYETGPNVTHLDVVLRSNGQPIASQEDLAPQDDGEYQVAFDIEQPGEYDLLIVAYMDDGSQEEATTGSFGVASIAEAVEPLGRFVTTLILGVAVVALSAFAAFGRWN